jgi:hypothetical protein
VSVGLIRWAVASIGAGGNGTVGGLTRLRYCTGARLGAAGRGAGAQGCGGGRAGWVRSRVPVCAGRGELIADERMMADAPFNPNAEIEAGTL